MRPTHFPWTQQLSTGVLTLKETREPNNILLLPGGYQSLSTGGAHFINGG